MNNKFKVSLFLLLSVPSMIVCMDELRAPKETNNQLAWSAPFDCGECLKVLCCYGCYSEPSLTPRDIEFRKNVGDALESATKAANNSENKD